MVCVVVAVFVSVAPVDEFIFVVIFVSILDSVTIPTCLLDTMPLAV